MENLATNKSFGIQSNPNSWNLENSKTYSSGNPHSKSLGQNSELAQWIEDAKAYYRGVMSGQEKRPDAQSWNTFMSELQWAKSQTIAADPGFGDPMMDAAGEGSQGPQVNEFGGEQGPKGNFNYDLTKTDIGFTGDKSRNDVFGSENTLRFPPSAKVSCEKTTDHGVEVLKVVVTTAKGTAVYFYDQQNSPDFKLDIQVPNASQVTGAEVLAGKITVSKPTTTGTDDSVQTKTEGKPVEGKPDSWYYEAKDSSETIDFFVKPGKNETHYVVGKLNLAKMPVSSKVAVQKSDDAEYDYKIVVTHMDKSTDTFYVRKDFPVNINAGTPKYVTFEGATEPGVVPDGMKESFTINGSEDTKDSTPVDAPLNPDHSEDTVPSEPISGKKAVYSAGGNVEIHSNYKDAVDTHEITTTGAVLLHGKSINDTITINKTGSTYTITFTDTTTTPVKTETYIVSGPPSKIIIDGLPGKMTGDARDDTMIVVGNNFGLAAGGTVPALIQQLIDQTGIDQATLLKNMWKNFPQVRDYDKPSNGGNGDGKLDMNELNNAFKKYPNFAEDLFGKEPTQAILDFIKTIDPAFSSEIDASTVWEGNSLASHWNKATTELVKVLKIMYPGVPDIAATFPGSTGASWGKCNDITFGGKHFNYTSETEGATNQAILGWY